jgi:hypothetical protein
MPKVYGSYKTGADIYRDNKSGKYYIFEWNPQTREPYKKFISFARADTNTNIGSWKSSRTTIKKSKTKKTQTQKHKQKGGTSISVPGEMRMFANNKFEYI